MSPGSTQRKNLAGGDCSFCLFSRPPWRAKTVDIASRMAKTSHGWRRPGMLSLLQIGCQRSRWSPSDAAWAPSYRLLPAKYLYGLIGNFFTSPDDDLE